MTRHGFNIMPKPMPVGLTGTHKKQMTRHGFNIMPKPMPIGLTGTHGSPVPVYNKPCCIAELLCSTAQ